jgi:hypothetical protein
MLNGKVYVFWDHKLVNSALRHKDLTFETLGLDFGQRVLGLSDHGIEKLWVRTTTSRPLPSRPRYTASRAMNGPDLQAMTSGALVYIAGQLNDVDDAGLKLRNLYRGLRYFITMVTSKGLYGSGDPAKKDPYYSTHCGTSHLP